MDAGEIIGEGTSSGHSTSNNYWVLEKYVTMYKGHVMNTVRDQKRGAKHGQVGLVDDDVVAAMPAAAPEIVAPTAMPEALPAQVAPVVAPARDRVVGPRMRRHQQANVPINVAAVAAADNAIERRDFTSSEVFWAFVASFGWRNTSEGGGNSGKVQRIIAGIHPDDKKDFIDAWNEKIKSIQASLTLIGAFETRVYNDNQWRNYINHCIALGKDVYDNLVGDPDFIMVLIDAGECNTLMIQ